MNPMNLRVSRTRCETSQRLNDPPKKHSTVISHRIHGAAIYGNMDPINIPQMLAYIPAPWILWDMFQTFDIISNWVPYMPVPIQFRVHFWQSPSKTARNDWRDLEYMAFMTFPSCWLDQKCGKKVNNKSLVGGFNHFEKSWTSSVGMMTFHSQYIYIYMESHSKFHGSSHHQADQQIWANYNISLTWIKAIWGWFPLLNMISSEVAVRSL